MTLHDPIEQAVELCEAYAEELFDDDSVFTRIIKWQDGDFEVYVKHGHSHGREPYRQRQEVVTYRHFDGVVVYADETRLIDRRDTETNERRELERPPFAPDAPADAEELREGSDDA